MTLMLKIISELLEWTKFNFVILTNFNQIILTKLNLTIFHFTTIQKVGKIFPVNS